MNDSFGGGGFSANVTNTQGGDAGETKKDGLLPVVIRQLLLADENVQMFGFNYAMVTTVAIVRDIQYSSTKITYLLEDHTGEISGSFWLDGDDTTKNPKLTKNAYARFVGALRNAGDVKTLMIYNAVEVMHPNEVTTHLLEVLYARFKSERLKNGAGPRIEGSSVAATPMVVDNTNSTAGGDQNPYGLSGINKTVFDAILVFKSDESGIGRAELDRRFPKIPKSEMDKIIEYMSAEGMIYTTIDSDHFLPCV